MGKPRALWLRLRGLFKRESRELEFSAEMESHLDMHIEENLRLGMTHEQARRDAVIKLGGMEQTRQAYRERGGLPVLETLAQDVMYGLRILRKNPGFSIVTILTLAVGIGANTALFSVVNGVLLNPLPYPHPEELVTVHASKPNFSQGSISYPNFRDWQRDNKTLAGLAVARPKGFSLTGLGETERIRAEYVSSDFFSILGVKPVLGRLFAPGEDEIGRGPIALISASFWQSKFGSKPDVLGKQLTLDGNNFTIVGVLPADFDLAVGNFFPRVVYVPMGQYPNTALNDRGAGLGIHGIARLKPGVTFAQAQDDMNRVSDHLAAEFPQDDKGIRARLVPMQASMVGSVRPLLLILLGAVGFVLLIACVNVANLMLARSSARAQEFAVRAALGARRVRILRQLLTESVLLALCGGGLGLVLAAWGTKAAISLLPPASLPRASEIHLSGPVLCFTLFVSLTVGILFGLLPALKVSGQPLHDVLKEGGRGGSGARHRMQNVLVVFEMAMALVLLAGAGLMIRSLVALSKVDPGFDPHGVTAFGLSAPPSMTNASPAEIRAYLRETHQRMQAVPGVRAVSFFGGGLPLSGDDDEALFWMENEPRPSNANDMHWALSYTAEPSYLDIFHIPLLQGRFFTDGDTQNSPRVVVIDSTFAKKYFGDESPLGKHINLEQNADRGDRKATVIGVVGHVMQWGLDNDTAVSIPLRAQIYFPLMQLDDSEFSMKDGLGQDVVMRADGDSTAAIKGIRHAMQQMDAEQVVSGEQTMDEKIANTLTEQRFSMILLSVFAVLAVLLSSLGMYGVVSYLVGQRTQEIGVRMALGADRGNVLRWVMGHGGRLALIGAGVGIVAALALTRVMGRSALLYGVKAYDPWTLGVVTGLLVLVALAACGVPALRATRIDPMTALRNE